MRQGFYLSPFGERIIEVIRIADNKFCQSYDLKFDERDFDLAVDGNATFHISILLLDWTYLGES